MTELVSVDRLVRTETVHRDSANVVLNACRTTARTSLPGVFSAERLVDGPHRRDPGPAHHRNDHRVSRAVGKSALSLRSADSDAPDRQVSGPRSTREGSLVDSAGTRVTAGAIPAAGAGELTFIGFKRGLNSVTNSVANAERTGVTGGESAAQLLTLRGALEAV
jgi:hypothetical protein